MIDSKSYQTAIDLVRYERDKYINPSYFLRCFRHTFTWWEDLLRARVKSPTAEAVKTLYALKQLEGEINLRTEGLCKSKPEGPALSTYAESLRKLINSPAVKFLKDQLKNGSEPGLYTIYFIQGKMLEAEDIYAAQFESLKQK